MWLKAFQTYVNSDYIESFHISSESGGKHYLVAKMVGGDVKRLYQSWPSDEERDLEAKGKGNEAKVLAERRRLDMMELMKGVVAMLSEKEIQELKDEVAELADEIWGDKKGKKIERKAKKGG